MVRPLCTAPSTPRTVPALSAFRRPLVLVVPAGTDLPRQHHTARMILVHVEHVVGGRPDHARAVGQDHRLKDVRHLSTSAPRKRSACRANRSEFGLVTSASRRAFRWRRKAGSVPTPGSYQVPPSVDEQRHPPCGIEATRDLGATLDELLHACRLGKRARSTILVEVNRRAFAGSIVRDGVVMDADAVELVARFAHQDLGPAIVAFVGAADDLDRRPPFPNLDEGAATTRQVGRIFGPPVVVAASSALVTAPVSGTRREELSRPHGGIRYKCQTI